MTRGERELIDGCGPLNLSCFHSGRGERNSEGVAAEMLKI